jgi:hypothetical protein
MKTILATILLMFLSACATTELSVTPEGVVEWNSKTFLKNVKDADVQWGGFHATLGSSVGDSAMIKASAQALQAGNLLLQCEADFTDYIEANQ